MTATLSPDRPTFRAVVADVAARAKERLPESVNGRIEAAVTLVLGGDVLFLDDGTVEVGSSSDPLKTYTVAGKACDCQDFAYGQAPQGWCQHRLAVAIQQRVQEHLVAQTPTPPPIELPEDLEVWPDNDILWAPEPPAPPPLPEAPVSITLKGTLHGQDVMVTLRGVDFASVKAQVEEAAQWLERPAPASPPPPQGQGQEWCTKHGVQMKLNQKEGRSWWSHRLSDGNYCKGR